MIIEQNVNKEQSKSKLAKNGKMLILGYSQVEVKLTLFVVYRDCV